MTDRADPVQHSGAFPLAVLMVDDEPQACKWFSRLYSNEFVVFTAGGVDEALALLQERGAQVGAVLTDYRMPGRNGVELLTELHRSHPHIARLLVSAYADKDVAMAAVNQGKVEQILEKPLEEALARPVLRKALASSHERIAQENRAKYLQDTLAFMAQELSSPLGTVRSYLSAIKERHSEADGHPPSTDAAKPTFGSPDVLSMIEAAQRGADFAHNLVSKFLMSERESASDGHNGSLLASTLVQEMLQNYPFDEQERQWIRCDIAADFELPQAHGMLYLALCTLVKNAVLALRSTPPGQPCLSITVYRCAPAPHLPVQPVIGVHDNGAGVSANVLAELARDPIGPPTGTGDHGMGLVFCQRIVSTLGGAMAVQSAPGDGAVIMLYFPHMQEAPLPDRT